MRFPIALRLDVTRGQLRVLIALLVALLIALIAFMVVALTESHQPAPKTLGTPLLSVGATAPAFDAKSANGHGAVTSTSLHGKTTVLNFFGSWCVPCKQETPLLARTAATRPKGVQFLGIDVPGTGHIDKNIVPFLKEAGVTYAVGADPSDSITSRYGVEGIPTTFLIAPDGKVEAEHDGALSAKLLDGWIAKAA